MSGMVVHLQLDAEGHVCGGRDCEPSQRTDFSKLPSLPLDPADIAWPDGEPWDHFTVALGVEYAAGRVQWGQP